MARIVTVHLLLDEPDETKINDGINDMMTAAQTPVDPDDPDQGSWLVDWWIGDAKPISSELEDAICNDTYEAGDMAQELP